MTYWNKWREECENIPPVGQFVVIDILLVIMIMDNYWRDFVQSISLNSFTIIICFELFDASLVILEISLAEGKYWIVSSWVSYEQDGNVKLNRRR